MLYHTKGGITLSQTENMKRKKFLWFLKRLSKQKVDENNAIKKQTQSAKNKRPASKRKFIGKV